MTTGWWLLLLLGVSSQSVDSQSTTDDETCNDGEGLVSQPLRDILHRILDNQQQIFQRLGNLPYIVYTEWSVKGATFISALTLSNLNQSWNCLLLLETE